MKITKQIKQALKECSYVGFRLEGRETTCEIVKRADDFDKEKHPFAQTEYFTVPVEQTVIRDYNRYRDMGGALKVREHEYKGWCCVENYKWHENEIDLLRNILKPGDRIDVEWLIGNNIYPVDDNPPWNLDECHLRLMRTLPKGDLKCLGTFTFFAGVTEPFSPCRMVQTVKVARMEEATA